MKTIILVLATIATILALPACATFGESYYINALNCEKVSGNVYRCEQLPDDYHSRDRVK